MNNEKLNESITETSPSNTDRHTNNDIIGNILGI